MKSYYECEVGTGQHFIYWYDTVLKLWTVQRIDYYGNQIGEECENYQNKEEMLRDHKFYFNELKDVKIEFTIHGIGTLGDWTYKRFMTVSPTESMESICVKLTNKLTPKQYSEFEEIIYEGVELSGVRTSTKADKWWIQTL